MGSSVHNSSSVLVKHSAPGAFDRSTFANWLLWLLFLLVVRVAERDCDGWLLPSESEIDLSPLTLPSLLLVVAEPAAAPVPFPKLPAAP